MSSTLIINAAQEDSVAPQEDAIPTVSAAKRDAVEAGLTEEEGNKKAKLAEEKAAETAVAPEPVSATSAEGPAPSPPSVASPVPAATPNEAPTPENGAGKGEDENDSEEDLTELDQDNVIQEGRRSTRNRPRPDYAALAKELGEDSDEDDEDAVIPETGEEDVEIEEDGDEDE
ncbi:hypothetical protein BDY24DRAFT_378755 [Mrakia frigida]|uniref:Chz1p n=1 Tax=Mrakia frigida TaxID=29902 RepID=UPI003FCC2530